MFHWLKKLFKSERKLATLEDLFTFYHVEMILRIASDLVKEEYEKQGFPYLFDVYQVHIESALKIIKGHNAFMEKNRDAVYIYLDPDASDGKLFYTKDLNEAKRKADETKRRIYAYNVEGGIYATQARIADRPNKPDYNF